MSEQTKQQEEQTASIVRSAEEFTKNLLTEGVFEYLPACNAEDKQTITFDTVMEDCDNRPEFINAIFELYKEIKKPLIEPKKSGVLGGLLLVLIHEIDEIVKGHVEFCANDENGVK